MATKSIAPACYASPFLVKVEPVAYISLTVIITEDAKHLTSYIMRLTNIILLAEKIASREQTSTHRIYYLGIMAFSQTAEMPENA
jgi:hypothetical protein